MYRSQLAGICFDNSILLNLVKAKAICHEKSNRVPIYA